MTGEWLEASVVALGWTLVHFIWQGAIIDLAHTRLLAYFDESRAQERYFIGLVALLLLAVVPPATFWLVFESPISVNGGLPAITGTAVLADTFNEVNNPGLFEILNFTIEAALPYMVALWGMGVLVYMSQIAIGMHAVNQLARSADYAAIPHWLNQELSHLLLHMRVTQKVRIALSMMVDSPLVIGWVRPLILLPLTSLTGLDRDQLRMVLTHELAHIRRLDHFVNLLQVIVETLLFYHPGVHRISRRLRAEREHCCDDTVAAMSGDRVAYARLLAELEERRHIKSEPALSLGMVDFELYDRINRLINPAWKERAAPSNLPLFCTLLTIMAILGFARTIDISQKLPSVGTPSISFELPLAGDKPVDTVTPVVTANPIPSSTYEAKTKPARHEPAIQIAAQQIKKEIRQDEEAVPAQVQNQSKSDKISVDVSDLLEQKVPHAATVTTINEYSSSEFSTDKPDIAKEEPVNTSGKLIHVVKPDYPRKALRQHIEGKVLLSFTVTETGKVEQVEIIDSKPSWIFDAAAIAAVNQWRYTPFHENGNAVAQRVTLPLEFRLNETISVSPMPRLSYDCSPTTGTRICTERNRALKTVQLEIKQE